MNTKYNACVIRKFVISMVNLMKLLPVHDIPEISDLYWHISKNKFKIHVEKLSIILTVIRN